MIVTFKTKAFGNITMFGDVAIRLLKLMGHSGTVPSAFKPEDVAGALQRLREAVAVDDASNADTSKVEKQTEDDEEAPVSLRNRALPLIELLEAAEKAQVHVMWES